MSFHIRFFSLISKNRVVKSVTEKDANLIILRLTPLAVLVRNDFFYYGCILRINLGKGQ